MSTIQLGVPYKDTFSTTNAQLVRDAVRQRFPAWADRCEPYINVLTLKAWNQRGYQVKKGEKAIRVFTKIPVTKTDEKTGEVKIVGSRPSSAFVFAFPQVEKRAFCRANTHNTLSAPASVNASSSSAAPAPTPSSGTCTSGISGTTSASSMP